MENILRPKRLNDIVGNGLIKQRVNISIKSAIDRDSALSHSIYTGGRGLGKTTFALAIANELGSDILITNGGTISNLKDILPYLVRMKRKDILFIDEVHRVSKKVQEMLYTAMEDFYIDPGRGAPKIDLEPFTLIGATTEEGTLLRPFRDRFTYKYSLSLYSNDELSLIIKNSAQKLQVEITKDAIKDLARMSRGTPRIANNYLIWLRDYGGIIDRRILEKAMVMIGVNRFGMTKEDRTYLQKLKDVGKPIGLSTLISMVNLSRETVEDVIEPFLIYKGWIRITPKGRIVV